MSQRRRPFLVQSEGHPVRRVVATSFIAAAKSARASSTSTGRVMVVTERDTGVARKFESDAATGKLMDMNPGRS